MTTSDGEYAWVYGSFGEWVTDDTGRRYFRVIARLENDGSLDWSGSDGWPDSPETP